MLALLVGAGFSKWSANLPLARGLFDFDIEPWGVQEKRQLEVVQAAKARWDTEHPTGQAEQFIADALRFPVDIREKTLWYIVRRLSVPFVWEEFHAQRPRRHQLMIDEHRKYQIPGIIEAQRFLQRFVSHQLAGVITTNYDLVIEYALGTKGFNYGNSGQILQGRGPYPVSQWPNPVTLTGTIPLAKIHGSISWDEHGMYTDGRRGITGNALIVAPTPEKQPPHRLSTVWALAEQILNRATSLLVFGFAFNPYDEAVLYLLRSAGNQLQSVLLIDRSEAVKNAAAQVWPHATITWSPPPPSGDATIQAWRQQAN